MWGESYEYYLVAIDMSELVSPQSNIGSAKLNNLPLSGEVVITKQRFNATKKEVVLAWDTNKLVNEPLVGSQVYRSVNGGKALKMGSVSAKTEFKQKLSKEGTYQYHIRVYGERGNIIRSAPIEIEVKKS